ncbi:MAG: hypothetical protein V4565_12390 [Bacteroidota bacterium]
MLKRDYLVKQFEEFGKVMGILLGLKRDGNFSELSNMINESLKKYTSLEIDYVETLENEKLLETLTHEKKLSDEQLKMLGDLLFEKGNYYSSDKKTEQQSINCFKKTLAIFQFLKEHATLNYSLDMHYKLQILEKMNL